MPITSTDPAANTPSQEFIYREYLPAPSEPVGMQPSSSSMGIRPTSIPPMMPLTRQ